MSKQGIAAHVSINPDEFYNSIAQASEALQRLRNSVKATVHDAPQDDIPEDRSYSTARCANNRFLAEMLLLAFQLNINFAIAGTDNNEGYVRRTADDNQHFDHELSAAFTVAEIAESIADAISRMIEEYFAMEARTFGSADYELEVTVVEGAFYDHHTGKMIAENAQNMATFMRFHSCTICIVPDYD